MLLAPESLQRPHQRSLHHLFETGEWRSLEDSIADLKGKAVAQTMYSAAPIPSTNSGFPMVPRCASRRLTWTVLDGLDGLTWVGVGTLAIHCGGATGKLLVTSIQVSGLHLTRQVATAEAQTANAARQHAPACRWHSRTAHQERYFSQSSKAEQQGDPILGGAPEFSGSLSTNGLIRIDRNDYPAHWQEIQLPEEVVLAWKEYRSKKVKAASTLYTITPRV
ncbi:hypothetical protein WJX77_009649 [Trebouxia sp. C0004]